MGLLKSFVTNTNLVPMVDNIPTADIIPLGNHIHTQGCTYVNVIGARKPMIDPISLTVAKEAPVRSYMPTLYQTMAIDAGL